MACWEDIRPEALSHRRHERARAIGVMRRTSQLMREGRLPVDKISCSAGVSLTILYRHLAPDG